MLGLDTLGCVYVLLFFLGVGYAAFLVITGGISSIDMPNVDIDVPQINLPGDVDIPGADIQIGAPDIPAGGLDSPDVAVSPLSPITIATFVTSFGGVGVISLQMFDVDPRLSLVFAAAAGLLLSGAMWLGYSQLLIRQQASSVVRRGELIGLEAEVTVPIGEATAGQVSYLTKTGRMSSPARSLDGRPISRGQLVLVVRNVGPQVLVRPIDLEAEEPGPGSS